MSAKMSGSALTGMKAYFCSTNDGNATCNWTVNGHQGPLQGTKPASQKIANCSYSYYYSYYSRKIVYSTTAHSWMYM